MTGAPPLQQLGDVSLNLLGRGGGSKARDGLALAVHQEFRKAPVDVTPDEPALLRLQPRIGRVCHLPIHVNLRERGEVHAVAEPALPVGDDSIEGEVSVSYDKRILTVTVPKAKPKTVSMQ